MKLRNALLLTAVPLLAACSSTTQGQAQTLAAPSTAASSPSPAVNAANPVLKAALLTVTDLPAGWSAFQSSDNSGGPASCPALNNGPWKKLPQSADANFSQGQAGPFLLEELASGSSNQVSAALQSFANATSTCSHFTSKSGSNTLDLTLTALSFPKYADSTYAFAITIKSDAGLNAAGDIVVVRKGNVLMEVTVFGFGSVPVSQAEDLVSKAVAKA